ncbi:MAG: hypothetical protein II565_10255 [Fibrobacter sp.]|nr:hypothetical protein [Fibrobacter sp.]
MKHEATSDIRRKNALWATDERRKARHPEERSDDIELLVIYYPTILRFEGAGSSEGMGSLRFGQWAWSLATTMSRLVSWYAELAEALPNHRAKEVRACPIAISQVDYNLYIRV